MKTHRLLSALLSSLLVTTVFAPRWQAELHFRSVKTQMRMAELDVCTPEMARKEFYTGLLPYSLVRAVGRRATARARDLTMKS